MPEQDIKRARRQPGPEHEQYMRGSEELQKEFETRLFWLAGGAVTLLVAGTPVLSQAGDVRFKWVLVAGVSSLLLGLMCTMIGLRVSAVMYVKLAEYFHDWDDDVYRRAVCMRRWISFLDWGAFASVMLGVVLGGIFYLSNILK
jgi:hypothetical protein